MRLLKTSKLIYIKILSFTIFLQYVSVYSFEKDSIKDTIQREKKYDLLLFPIIYYAPDTKWGTGGRVGLYSTKNHSSGYINLFISQLLQYEILFANELYLDHWKNIGKMKISSFPDKYYEIGNLSPENNVKYTDFYLWMLLSSQYHLNNYYLGIEIESRIERMNEGFNETVWGENDWDCIGIGAKISYDTRDNVCYPIRGSYFDCTAKYFIPTKETIGIERITIDYRYFNNLFKSNIVGIQTWIDISSGTPFQILPSVGDAVRGYTISRYKDNNCAAIQLEDRFIIWKRLGGVVFFGSGDVFNKIYDLKKKEIKFAGGSGLRFRLNNEKVNLRVDYAINSKNEGSMYLSFGEQF